MTQYIGQITVIVEAEQPQHAEEQLRVLAKQLDDAFPDVIFADHNGDVEDYDQIEKECAESVDTMQAEDPQATEKNLARVVLKIASDYLNIKTLVTRKSDSLDFYDVAVWQVKAALEAAFDAGARMSLHAEPGLPVRFDAYEIQPCHRYFDADEPDLAFVEPCEPYEADFWTVYGHIPGEGVQAIGDFDTNEHAEEVFARITGRSYTGRVRKTGGANHE
jgi:hypothetical protein